MFVEINGNQLAVEVMGPEGAPVIIAHHGGPGAASRAEPRASFGQLSDTYRVVIFDARGSGESGLNGPFSHEQWAADVDALREWIGVEQIIMAGGSYGGFIAQEYAIRYPERVRALLLRDTAPDNSFHALARANALASDRTKVDPEKLDRILEGRIIDNDDLSVCNREIMPLYDFKFSAEKMEKKLAATPYHYATHNEAFSVNIPQFDLKDKLPGITVPTLVTVGRVDWIVPVVCSETIAELIPNSTLVVFEESGHSPQVEQVDEWVKVVRDFVTEHVPVV